jgi:hypothetical protein
MECETLIDTGTIQRQYDVLHPCSSSTCCCRVLLAAAQFSLSRSLSLSLSVVSTPSSLSQTDQLVSCVGVIEQPSLRQRTRLDP